MFRRTLNYKGHSSVSSTTYVSARLKDRFHEVARFMHLSPPVGNGVLRMGGALSEISQGAGQRLAAFHSRRARIRRHEFHVGAQFGDHRTLPAFADGLLARCGQIICLWRINSTAPLLKSRRAECKAPLPPGCRVQAFSLFSQYLNPRLWGCWPSAPPHSSSVAVTWPPS
jgi:hypothetical protein